MADVLITPVVSRRSLFLSLSTSDFDHYCHSIGFCHSVNYELLCSYDWYDKYHLHNSLFDNDTSLQGALTQ